jgi:hypothetical protein
MKKDNKELISEMRNMLNSDKNTKKKLTVESLVFDEPEMGGYPDEMNNPGFDDGQPDFFEEGDTISGETAQIVNQMRIMCLDGLRKLANNPESNEYDLLKKIWNLCDKTVGADQNNNNGNANNNNNGTNNRR